MSSFPGSFFLSANDRAGAGGYLAVKGWLDAGESVQAMERPGEGNMNCVLRFRTNMRSFILKQSRPWVEKYPAIAAPWDRALVEEQFYRAVGTHADIQARMPKLLAFDREERLLMLEDLGEASDFTFLYSDGQQLAEADLRVIVEFLVVLHGEFRGQSLARSFVNGAMRKLNHEYIFNVPLQGDEAFRCEVAAAGQMYLECPEDGCLLHGDYYPGSWLKTERGVFVIDPEFCFYGPAEWDVGVMLAHLHLSGQPGGAGDAALDLYGSRAPLDRKLAVKFAGIEILRRLLGVAQLPLACGLPEKERLLRVARDLVLG